MAAWPDGRIVVTGEFYGPPLRLGSLSLCEMQPGMPPAEESAFNRSPDGGRGPCSCDPYQRDLFLLALDKQGEPLWAKTLGLGHRAPRVTIGANGNIVWVARIRHAGDLGKPTNPAKDTVVSLWELDAKGAVLRRRGIASGGANLLKSAADGGVYLSDSRVLQRITIAR